MDQRPKAETVEDYLKRKGPFCQYEPSILHDLAWISCDSKELLGACLVGELERFME